MYFADDIYDCFTKMCNLGKTPPGGFFPHNEGRLAPPMGQEASSGFKKKSL